jgi:hypothetical protein
MNRNFWIPGKPGLLFLMISALTIIIVTSFQTWNEVPLSNYEGKGVTEILEMMPRRDKTRLEHFFREYVICESMGYVLFGDKPMAFSGIDKKLSPSPFKSFASFLYAISPRRIQFKNAFDTWKKYEKLFPMKRFTFLYEETNSEINCLFINKRSFLQKVEENAEIFKTILQRNVTAEGLLKEGLQKPFFSEVLSDHEVLIGILFGFGKHNAELFNQRSQLSSNIERNNFCQNFGFEDAWKHEFEEIDAKWNEIGWLNAYVTGNHLKNLELTMLPGFYADVNHPETLQIKEHFLEQREKTLNFYKDKDFLAATLQELTSD